MKLQVTDHEYMNTGGGCMVSIFTIYDAQRNRTLYLMINEAGGSLSTADYIRTELDFDDSMLLDNFNIDTLEPTDNNFELFRDCFMEYVKRDCQRHKHTYALRFEQLPKELQQQLTPDYREWHYENIGNTFETDGYDLFLSEEYVEPDADILKAESMLQHMADEMNKQILQLMMDHMDGNNASAPNTISDAVYELLYNNNVDGLLAEKISDAAFELAAAMVADVGKYI